MYNRFLRAHAQPQEEGAPPLPPPPKPGGLNLPGKLEPGDLILILILLLIWLEKEDVLKSNWIWHMDSLMRIMADGEYTELFLDAANEWKPVLK